MSGTELHWINHASYVLCGGAFSLLVDPWLHGRVFNGSWAHIAPTRFDRDLLASVTHLWFSHEHPDHFHPPDLRYLREQLGAEPTVLFQRTEDGRVAEFCRKLGFEVVELGDDERYRLAEDAWLELHGSGPLDSWSFVRTPDLGVLNLNDCVLTESDLQHLVARYRGCDVLLTQFSYAAWTGNADETGRRRASVDGKLRAIERLCAALHPKTVLPCASFVYFCHEENRYMNDAIPDPGAVEARLRSACDAQIVIPYPGDVWSTDRAWDNASRIASYRRDLEQCAEFATARSVPVYELEALGNAYLRRMRERNGRLVVDVLGGLSLLAARGGRVGLGPVRLWVTDLEQAWRFDLLRGLTRLSSDSAVDVELGSESLAFLLRHDFGFATLNVSGRYQVRVPDGQLRLSRAFSLGQINSTGTTALRHLFRRLTRRRAAQLTETPAAAPEG